MLKNGELAKSSSEKEQLVLFGFALFEILWSLHQSSMCSAVNDGLGLLSFLSLSLQCLRCKQGLMYVRPAVYQLSCIPSPCLFVSLFFFWDRILCSLGWLQAHCIPEDDLELLIFPLSPKFKDCRYMPSAITLSVSRWIFNSEKAL